MRSLILNHHRKLNRKWNYFDLNILPFSVAPAQPHMCQTLDVIHLAPPGGYIGKQTLQESGAYLNDCIWSVEVRAGQKISFTVFSFQYGQARGTRGGNPQSAGECLTGLQGLFTLHCACVLRCPTPIGQSSCNDLDLPTSAEQRCTQNATNRGAGRLL